MAIKDQRSEQEKEISRKRINLAIGFVDVLFVAYIVLHILGVIG